MSELGVVSATAYVGPEYKPPTPSLRASARARAPDADPGSPPDGVDRGLVRPDANLKRFEDRTQALGTANGIPAARASDNGRGTSRFTENGGAIEVQRRPPPGSDDARLRQIRERLAQTPTGRRVLEQLDRSGANVVFGPGRAYYYDPDTNTITIGRDLDVDQQAVQLAHEAQHADEERSGQVRDPRSFRDGDEYATERIEEEVRATEQQIRLANELGLSNVIMQREYNEAYQRAYEAARARQRAQGIDDDAAARREAEEAGRARLRQGFNNGEVTVSFNGMNYRDYYRDAWNRFMAEQGGQKLQNNNLKEQRLP